MRQLVSVIRVEDDIILSSPAATSKRLTSEQQTDFTQRVYMTLKETESLCQSDYDRLCKMHVFTLVWLKSDRIRFLIVGLKHPDYWLIVSLLLHVNVPSDQIRFCVLHRLEISFPEPWARSRRTAASFLPNHCKKERKSSIVHLVV